MWDAPGMRKSATLARRRGSRALDATRTPVEGARARGTRQNFAAMTIASFARAGSEPGLGFWTSRKQTVFPLMNAIADLVDPADA